MDMLGGGVSIIIIIIIYLHQTTKVHNREQSKIK